MALAVVNTNVMPKSPRTPLKTAKSQGDKIASPGALRRGNYPTSSKNIRVFLRVRPKGTNEDDDAVSVLDENEVKLRGSKQAYGDSDRSAPMSTDGEAPEKIFPFAHVFGPRSSQGDVYDKVARDTVKDVFSGYHGLIFVYGQTGTGKTYTLCNYAQGQEGVLVRAVHEVYNTIASSEEEFETSMQMVQLYQETFQDLLVGQSRNIQLHDDPEVDAGVVLDGATCHPIKSAEECMSLYCEGDQRRAFGSTLMNDKSSRSHTLFVLNVTKKSTGEDSELKGRLILVDLAGSERVRKTGCTGVRLNEAKSINTSLLVLGRVVNNLTEPSAPHVPFRDSKLTRFLQYALSGNGKTSIVITVNPASAHYEETLSAIQFGQRAMKIKQDAKVHKKIDYKALAQKLQAELDLKVVRVDSAPHHFAPRVAILEAEVSRLRQENGQLREQSKGNACMHEALKMEAEVLGTHAEENEVQLQAMASENAKLSSMLEEAVLYAGNMCDRMGEGNGAEQMVELQAQLKQVAAQLAEKDRQSEKYVHQTQSLRTQVELLSKKCANLENSNQQMSERDQELAILGMELEEKERGLAERDLLLQTQLEELEAMGIILEEKAQENQGRPSLTAAFGAMETELKSLRDGLQARDEEIHALKATQREQETSTIMALQQDLMTKESTLSAVNQRLQESEDDMRGLLASKEREIQERSALILSFNDLQSEMNNLANTLQEREDEMAELSLRYESKNNEIKAQLRARENDLDTLKTTFQKKEAQRIKDIQGKDAEIAGLHARLEDEALNRKASFAGATVTRENEAALQEMMEEIDSLRSVCDNREAQVKEHESTIKVLRKQWLEASGLAERRERMMQDLEEQASVDKASMERALVQATQRHKECSDQLLECKQRLCDAQAKILDLEAEISHITTSVTSTHIDKRAVGRLEADLKDARDQLETLTHKLHIKDEMEFSLREELRCLQEVAGQKDDLEAQLCNTVTRADLLDEDINAKDMVIADLQDVVDTLQEQLSLHQQQTEELASERERLEAELQSAWDQIQAKGGDAQLKISHLSEELLASQEDNLVLKNEMDACQSMYKETLVKYQKLSETLDQVQTQYEDVEARYKALDERYQAVILKKSRSVESEDGEPKKSKREKGTPEEEKERRKQKLLEKGLRLMAKNAKCTPVNVGTADAAGPAIWSGVITKSTLGQGVNVTLTDNPELTSPPKYTEPLVWDFSEKADSMSKPSPRAPNPKPSPRKVKESTGVTGGTALAWDL